MSSEHFSILLLNKYIIMILRYIIMPLGLFQWLRQPGPHTTLGLCTGGSVDLGYRRSGVQAKLALEQGF